MPATPAEQRASSDLKRGTLSTKRLQWATVALPILFLGAMLLFWELVLDMVWPHLASEVLMVALIVLGVLVFSRAVFRLLEQRQRDLLKRNRELWAINTVAAAVSASLDLDQMLATALDSVLDVADMEAGEIWLLEGASGAMARVLRRGAIQESPGEKPEGRPGEALLRQVAQSGEPRTGMAQAGLGFYACVPLKSKRRVVGVMVVSRSQGEAPGLPELSLLGSLGAHIGMAVENAWLYEQVQDLAVLQERDRIAREMHDGLAQVLGYLNLKIDRLQSEARPSPEAGEDLAQMKKAVREAYADVREAIVGLRASVAAPGDLIPSVERYLKLWGEEAGIEAHLLAQDGPAELDLRGEIQLIRILQEALSNVRKHARARRVWVHLTSVHGNLKVRVDDDGCGFDPLNVPRHGRQHFGLFIMRERAESLGGSLDIDSAPGRGTRLIVTLPTIQQGRDKDGTDPGASGR